MRYATVLFLLIASQTFAQRIPIAVLDFDARGISNIEAQTLTDRLRNELFRLGTFRVLDRGNMESILLEQDFQMSGCTSDECLVEVGRLLGAQRMAGGSISKFGEIFTVSARLIDVETGELLNVADFDLSGAFEDLLTRGMREVASMLADYESAQPTQLAIPTIESMNIQVERSDPAIPSSGNFVFAPSDYSGLWKLSLLLPFETRPWVTIQFSVTGDKISAKVVDNLYALEFSPKNWTRIRIVETYFDDGSVVLKTNNIGEVGGSTLRLSPSKIKDTIHGTNTRSTPPHDVRQVTASRKN